MALVLRNIYEFYHIFFNTHADPRTVDWPLLGSPAKIVILMVTFYYIVKVGGPKFMQNREPYNLKHIMMGYNLFQVVINLYLGVKAYRLSYGTKEWSFECHSLNNQLTEQDLEITKATYFYFMLKILDLIDTIFLVLRKNNKKINFLHVYHHLGMVLAAYLASKFYPGGHAILLGIINCFVHCAMYFYFFLTAISDRVKKSLWWKKYITQIQMIQFVTLAFHFVRPLFAENCDYPKFICVIMILQNLFMSLLFLDFYINAYVIRKKINK